MANKRPIIAFIYDFDGTLSPGNMQEYNYIPDLGIHPKQFWAAVKAKAKVHQADEIIVYMLEMLDRARNKIKIRKTDFNAYGKKVTLFNGVEGWFSRINQYARNLKLTPQHYIISSGIKEMIEGTTIAKEFQEIFASSFIYEQHGIAESPGLAINYTTKTQFLFRINKGAMDITDSKSINEYKDDSERIVPFANMIFIGDGDTDIPCMKLVKAQGGHSIAVYKPRKRAKAIQLLNEKRVNYVTAADYSEGGNLDVYVQAVIAKVAADCRIAKLKKSI